MREELVFVHSFDAKLAKDAKDSKDPVTIVYKDFDNEMLKFDGKYEKVRQFLIVLDLGFFDLGHVCALLCCRVQLCSGTSMFTLFRCIDVPNRQSHCLHTETLEQP